MPVVLPVLGPDPVVNQRGFILAEEDALKQKLAGISVADLRPKAPAGATMPVGIWYRNPEAITEKTYPFITIDLLDVSFAADRAHDLNFIDVEEWPSTYVDYVADSDDKIPEGANVQAMRYLPHDLWFQVATHSRLAQHDRELHARLLTTNYLPYRLGYLEVPADNTVRYLFLQSWQQADIGEDPQSSRRLFRKVYTVKVHTYLPAEWPIWFSTVKEVHGVIKTTDGEAADESWEYSG